MTVWLDDFALPRFSAGGNNAGGIETENGGHGAGTDRHRLLHGGGAQTD